MSLKLEPKLEARVAEVGEEVALAIALVDESVHSAQLDAMIARRGLPSLIRGHTRSYVVSKLEGAGWQYSRFDNMLCAPHDWPIPF